MNQPSLLDHPVTPSLDVLLTRFCEYCGDPVPKQSSGNKRRFCAPACFYASLRRDTPDVFWGYTQHTSRGCVEWTGARDRRGYGLVGVQGRKNVGAHRHAWRLVHGEIPNGMQVCHSCDNPPCVNPEHLFLGTHQDNMDDRTRKGRHANGYPPATHGSIHYYQAYKCRCDACHARMAEYWAAARKRVKARKQAAKDGLPA